MTNAKRLAGRHIMIVEDEYFLASDMATAVVSAGGHVVGPFGTVEQALGSLASAPVEGAILDVNLQGEMVYPVADALIARGTPFVFATGYDRDVVPDRYAAISKCRKPVDPDIVAQMLLAL